MCRLTWWQRRLLLTAYTTMSRIKIDPPNQLPSSGITAIQYKQWKVALKIFLQQTAEFREFYPGGKYPKWDGLEDNPNRLDKLHDEDKKHTSAENVEHLAQRRINLETFLGIIARYSDEGDFDDIMEKSNNLEYIFQLHERRYGIQRKGRYFHRMDTIRFDKSTMTDHNKFYNDLRSCFKSNLLKKGDMVKHKNTVMTTDEKVSPTTECLLISMALERIDTRLPAEIDRIFGHRMNDGTSLMDLQSEIFSYIPRALEAVDRDEMVCNAYNLHTNTETFDEPPTVDINAVSYNNKPRSQYKPEFRGQNKPYRPNQSRNFTKKFCKVCQALEMPNYIVNSHNPSDCRKKTTLQQIAIEEAENSNDHEATDYVPQQED